MLFIKNKNKRSQRRPKNKVQRNQKARKPSGLLSRKVKMILAALIISPLIIMGVIISFAEPVKHSLENHYARFLEASTGDESDPIRLRLEHVFIEGQHYVNQETLLELLGADIGTPILGIDIHAIKENIQNNPWIKQASVERQLPNTLHIRITERKPVALWQNNNNVVLLDEEGDIIPQVNLAGFRDFLLIVGEDAPRHIQSLLPVLERDPIITTSIQSAVRISKRRWDIHLTNGLVIKLPEENMLDAWNLLLVAQKKKNILENTTIGAIDLRLNDRLTMQYKDGSSNKGV